MISELGQRHLARLRACLQAYEDGESNLPRLVNEVEGLIALLIDEADSEWLEELESEANRLEFINSSGPVGRTLGQEDAAEVLDAIAQLRLITEPYE